MSFDKLHKQFFVERTMRKLESYMPQGSDVQESATRLYNFRFLFLDDDIYLDRPTAKKLCKIGVR